MSDIKSQMLNYIDTSTTTLFGAAVIFVLVLLAVKNRLDASNEKATEKRESYMIILYSVIAGIIGALIVLFGAKRFVTKNNLEILTDPYPTIP